MILIKGQLRDLSSAECNLHIPDILNVSCSEKYHQDASDQNDTVFIAIITVFKIKWIDLQSEE